jgi:hypothetical protein
MAFVKINSGVRTGERVRISSSKGGHNFQLRMSADLFRRLGEPSLVDTFLGEGKDDGFLAIAVSKMGGRKVLRRNRQINIAASKLGITTPSETQTVTAPHHFDGDMLIIDIRPLRGETQSLMAAE